MSEKLKVKAAKITKGQIDGWGRSSTMTKAIELPDCQSARLTISCTTELMSDVR